MLTLFTMEEGKTIVDLFTPENMAAWEAIEEEVLADPGVQSVVTPRAALEFTQRMVTMTRSEEHTSELQSLMPTSYPVFLLKKKNRKTHIKITIHKKNMLFD